MMTKTFRLFAMLLLFWVTPYGVFAENQAPAKKEDTVTIPQNFPVEEEHPEHIEKDLMSEFWQMMFYLGLILGLFIVVTWYLKKVNVARSQQMNESSMIKILETRNLSPKSMIHLIEIGNTHLVVGETGSGITRLGHFSKNHDQFSRFLDKKVPEES